MLASSHLLYSNDILERTEMAFCKIEVFCFPSQFFLSVRMIMEKLHCVLPSCCPMNDSCAGFIHQGMENVVIKVPVSLLSHSTEHKVKGRFLSLEHRCKSGILLTWDCWNPDQNLSFGKREQCLEDWMLWQFMDICALLASHGNSDLSNGRSHLLLQNLKSHCAVGRLWALGIKKPQHRGAGGYSYVYK